MHRNLKLSVIIVNYNVQHFLEQCLQSVFKALQNIESEVWVVDNNSVDGSVAMIQEKFPDVKLFASKNNLGFSRGNNLAIKKSSGEYTLLLNPDTLVEEDTFEKVIKFMDNTPKAGGLGVKMVDGKGNFLPESKRSLPTPSVAFYKIFGLSSLFPKSKRFGKYHCGHLDKNENHEIEILSGAFMLMRKSALDEVGMLDEDFFMYGEDIDLSYRLLKGGYKNYYFADTRIIHYKGESTKKSSVNYVFVFYNAMIIFAKKHFSSKNASLFSFLIKIAIYFRASIAILNRMVKKSALPILDASLLLGGILSFKHLWESKIKGFSYPNELQYYFIPGISLIILMSVAFFGGYKKKLKLSKILRGVIFGAVTIFIGYGFIDEKYRFSRAIIAFSAVWSSIALISSRMLLQFFKYGDFEIDSNSRKNVGIIGNTKEIERVKDILQKSNFLLQNFVFIASDNSSENKSFVGNINQLNEIIQIHKLDEVIFCAKDLSSNKIIETMESLSNHDAEFKIAPPESLFILGSSSIDSPGELYLIDINSLNKPENIRNKRIFDVISSIILLFTSPLLVLLVKEPSKMFGNIINVFKGKFTWVGYSKSLNSKNELPILKSSILSPLDRFDEKNLEKETIERLNMQYVKDYHPLNDLAILIKGLKKIDQ
ncbi:MAG: glycosyltransferase [Flavobacteriales bacterium]|nr:glycosyltransferase [Flavobacteriales bacterium]